MSTLADIKRAVQVGAVYDVTNHYIKREDHPCFGTRRETIAKVNGSSFCFASSRHGIPWPKASQVQMDADGTIRMYGGGRAQADDELFLTLVPAVPGCWRIRLYEVGAGEEFAVDPKCYPSKEAAHAELIRTLRWSNEFAGSDAFPNSKRWAGGTVVAA